MLRNLIFNTKEHEHSLWFSISCSMFPKSTHETFAQKMYQTYKGHKRFSKPKLARTDFNINHYAGDVCVIMRGILIIFCAYDFLIFLFCLNRLPIKPINSWTKIRIMLLQNIKLYWLLLIAHLLQIFSLRCLMNHQSNPSFLPLVPASR